MMSNLLFFAMDPFKTLGLDGYPACFYQKTWGVVANSMVALVLDVLRGKPIPNGICDILVTLLPKVQGLELISQFRPISLCNVAYKAITKVLASRMKWVLPFLILSTQCSFIPGR